MPTSSEALLDAALSFTRLLAARSYGDAYAMTSREYRESVGLEQMKDAFEAIVPLDWGDFEPVEVVQTMDDWPGKRDSDLVWVYVSIYGDMYGEAVTLVFTSEGGEARVREVEFGRP